MNYNPHKSFICDWKNPKEWAVNLFLLPSTRKSRQSLCNWKRMGRPAVLLFPVRGKLQSLQRSVFIGPLSVSWNLSRCRLIGPSLHCEDLPSNQHLPGWVPLPLPTSCCSQSAYSAAWVCVCVCGHPLLPLPSFSSTKQPAHPPFHSHPPFPHTLIHSVFLAHTHARE